MREAGSAAPKPLRDLAAWFLELSQDGIILMAEPGGCENTALFKFSRTQLLITEPGFSFCSILAEIPGFFLVGTVFCSDHSFSYRLKAADLKPKDCNTSFWSCPRIQSDLIKHQQGVSSVQNSSPLSVSPWAAIKPAGTGQNISPLSQVQLYMQSMFLSLLMSVWASPAPNLPWSTEPTSQSCIWTHPRHDFDTSKGNATRCRCRCRSPRRSGCTELCCPTWACHRPPPYPSSQGLHSWGSAGSVPGLEPSVS